MVWMLLFVGVLIFAWWLFAPRRLQTLENIPAVIDQDLKVNPLVETVEDEREVRPLAEAAAKQAGDIPVEGHGDSLTFDWPSDEQEPYDQGERSHQGPLNNQ